MVAHLRRMPGPVLTMAVWSLIILVDTIVVALWAGEHAEDYEGLAWVLGPIFEALVLVVCLGLGARTPTWFLQFVLLVRLGCAVLLAAVGGPIDGLLFGYVTAVFVVVYAAYWWHSWLTYFYAILAAGSTFALGFIPETSDRVVQTWFLVTCLLVIMGAGLNRVVAAQQRQARRDPLTGLPNRIALNDYLRSGPPIGRSRAGTLVLIDLDSFKRVNDDEGHLAGDRLLVELTSAWSAALRPDDMLFRVGGDEFLLVLPATQDKDLDALMDRLRAAYAFPWSYGTADWSVGEDFDPAFGVADDLMYRQKQARGGSRE